MKTGYKMKVLCPPLLTNRKVSPNDNMKFQREWIGVCLSRKSRILKRSSEGSLTLFSSDVYFQKIHVTF